MASGGVSPALGGSSPAPGLASVTGLPHGHSLLNPATVLKEGNSTTAKTVICVFCGASPGKSPAHMEAARSLGRIFHENNISLVYGGGTVGLMGEVAKTLVSLSGPESVHGIIPAPLVKYERSDIESTTPDGAFKKGPDGKLLPAYEIYGRTTIVEDMHTRKHQMAQEVLAGGPGSGFIALSGGYGTLEELMEVVTWNQLGIHNRGVVVYNVEGYWDGLLSWVRNSVEAGFVGVLNQGIIVEGKSAEECVRELREYKAAEGRFNLSWGTTGKTEKEG